MRSVGHVLRHRLCGVYAMQKIVVFSVILVAHVALLSMDSPLSRAAREKCAQGLQCVRQRATSAYISALENGDLQRADRLSKEMVVNSWEVSQALVNCATLGNVSCVEYILNMYPYRDIFQLSWCTEDAFGQAVAFGHASVVRMIYKHCGGHFLGVFEPELYRALMIGKQDLVLEILTTLANSHQRALILYDAKENNHELLVSFFERHALSVDESGPVGLSSSPSVGFDFGFHGVKAAQSGAEVKPSTMRTRRRLADLRVDSSYKPRCFDQPILKASDVLQ